MSDVELRPGRLVPVLRGRTVAEAEVVHTEYAEVLVLHFEDGARLELEGMQDYLTEITSVGAELTPSDLAPDGDPDHPDAHLRCRVCGWLYPLMHRPADEPCDECGGPLRVVVP